MKISLLEFGEGDEKANSLVRLKNVFDYAIKADELEYNRFWLAEHHLYSRKLAWACPLSVVPVIASVTHKIRVGTGGILLKLHNAFDVASQFKLWNNIYSNRMDLGLANGGDPKIQKLISNETIQSFDDKFSEVVNFLNKEEELFKNKVVMPPYKGVPPELWALGTSCSGFHRSLKYGTDYVRSIFHEVSELNYERQPFENFKMEFLRLHGRKVKTMLAISGACLKSENRLKELKQIGEKDDKHHLIGNVDYFRDKLPELLDTYGADEILWRDMNRDINGKFETLELLSDFLTEGIPIHTSLK